MCESCKVFTDTCNNFKKEVSYFYSIDKFDLGHKFTKVHWLKPRFYPGLCFFGDIPIVDNKSPEFLSKKLIVQSLH